MLVWDAYTTAYTYANETYFKSQDMGNGGCYDAQSWQCRQGHDIPTPRKSLKKHRIHIFDMDRAS